MVHGFMTQSGGTVSVSSQVGIGTSVKLYFPEANSPDVRKTPATQAQKTQTELARILVVEDQPDVRCVLQMMLEQEGHEILSAESGVAALELFAKADKVDLLMTDIVMPSSVQGYELAQRLCAIDEKLPVIFLSGYAHEQFVQGNGPRNSDIRLTKPVSKATLAQAVQDALGK